MKKKKTILWFYDYFQGNHCFLPAESPSSVGISHGLIKMNETHNLTSFQKDIFNRKQNLQLYFVKKNPSDSQAMNTFYCWPKKMKDK